MATEHLQGLTMQQPFYKEKKDVKCIFCNRKEDDEIIFGRFEMHGNFKAHYHCLFFSSCLEQNNQKVDNMLGFLNKDISKEIKRGMGLKCHKCGTKGATVDCSNTKCKRVYHFGCGTDSGMLNQYCGAFNSFCIDHRPTQKVPKCFLKGLPITCTICNEMVIAKPSNGVLWAPCCKENWFHRDCMQRLALKYSGEYFKCPICYDKGFFTQEMKRMGIYVADEFSSGWTWTLKPRQGTYPLPERFELHCRCNHPTCICPKGRSHDDVDVGMDWKLMTCSCCRSKRIHISCGKLDANKSEWYCKSCESGESNKIGESSKQNRRKLPSTGLEAPSSPAAPKRSRPGKRGNPDTGSPIGANESEVEFVGTVSASSSCSQSPHYEPKPSCSADGAQCSPQQVRIAPQRKSYSVDKAPVHSSSTTSAPVEMPSSSTGPCLASTNSTLVSPARGVFTLGQPNLTLTQARGIAFSTESTAPLVTNGGCKEKDGSNDPSNSEEQGAAEVNQHHQQQERQVPASNEREDAENQPPFIVNPPELTGMDYPKNLVEVGELSYQGLTIKIFKNGTFDKFFFEPIAVLDQKSVVIQSQKLFKEDVVRFSILMWTPEIRSKVLERLRLKNIQVDEDDVRAMPFDSVQLVAKPGSIHQSIKIMGEAIPYQRLNEKLDFFLLCDSPSTAQDLADNLRDSPDFLVRRWQLSLECRGLSLNPSVSDDETSTDNPPFVKLITVSTFPAVGSTQSSGCAAKETILQLPSITDYDNQLKDLKAQVQELMDKSKNATP